MLAISQWLLLAPTFSCQPQVLIKIRGSARCLIYKIGFKSGNQNEIDMYFEPEDDLIKSNLWKSKKSEYDDAISE